MKGAILNNDRGVIYDMHKILEPIKDTFIKYNWLITDWECLYKPDPEIPFGPDGDYVWISGEEFFELSKEFTIGYVWSVFSGIPKNITMEEALDIDEPPYANGYRGFWENPISIQHPLAEIEIAPWDGMMLLLISKDDSVIERFMDTHLLCCEDLEKYNDED